MSAPTFTVPEGVVCNGRQDFGEGRPVLICFTDMEKATEGDFYVTETNCTTEIILGALKKHRKRMSEPAFPIPPEAAACFAPVL